MFTPVRTRQFNLTEAKRELAALPDKELHALFVRHLNYIPGSSYTHVAMQELQRRGLWQA
jgi:hypothetical protein